MANVSFNVAEAHYCDCHQKFAWRAYVGHPTRKYIRCIQCACSRWMIELRRRKNLRVIH